MADADADLAMAVDDGEGVPSFGDGDIAAEVLSRFQSSTLEDHQHLCATAAAICQSIRDENKPLSPVAYFAATAASVAKLAADPVAATSSPAVTAAILCFLSSQVAPRTTSSVLRSRGLDVAKDVASVLALAQSMPDYGVKAGIVCISRFIVVGEKGSWDRIEPLYKVVVGFATDRRPKVRKQSHSCLHEILQSFHKQAILVPASEVLTGAFERFLLLAGGSSTTNSSTDEERRSSAMNLLYTLNAFKSCLTSMSAKSSNIMLKYFKDLLELHRPIVTKNVLDILRTLGNSPMLDLNLELLLDLLCSVSMVAVEKKSGDEMASIAHLLLVSIRRIYGLNKNICIHKLPLIFNALGGILTSAHEEAVFASREALKGLICSCIDESLISQGVARVNARNENKAAPAIIEKICATLEGLLHVNYATIWDSAFDVISVAYENLGQSSQDLMASILVDLINMQKFPDEVLTYRKQLHACIGSAVAAMGPENFLRIAQVQTICEDNVWLLLIMKQHIVGATLRFFVEDISSMIRSIQHKIPKLKSEGKLFSVKRAEGYVYSLWSLLPAFCNYPYDMSRTFRSLQDIICKELLNVPDLRGIICSSLQVLIKQNREILLGKNDGTVPENGMHLSEKRARDHYTEQVAQENLDVLKAYSAKLLETLRSVFLDASTEFNQNILVASHEVASIADRAVIAKIFKKTMKELLAATKEAIYEEKPENSSAMQIDSSSNALSTKRALLLDFSASLMPGLSEEEIELLYSSVKPALKDQDSIIQKRAYKILSIVLKDSDQFIKKNIDGLLDLMVKCLPTQDSSKRYRLECLYHLIVYILKDSLGLRKKDALSFLTEILLSLKEANKKTRNRAYDLIVEIGRACQNEEADERKGQLHQFFSMVAGGLASQTPHSISASVRGLARLTYEFSELIGVAYNLLPSTFLLLQRKDREVVKENLSFVKVLVVKSSADVLREHLKGIIEGLLNDSMKYFKSKIKYLIEMLVKKCGIDAVKAVMPKEHNKLLTNIRKMKERKDRKVNSSDGDSMASKSRISRASGWNHTKIFSDFEDEEDESVGGYSEVEGARSAKTKTKKSSRPESVRVKRKRPGSMGLLEDLNGELNDDPLDLLDRRVVRSALQTTAKAENQVSSDEEPEIDPEGKLIVREEGRRNTKKKASENNSDARSIGSRSAVSSTTAKNNKRRKTVESSWAYTGDEYTSKKGRGDAQKSGKLEPYAYLPLDRKLLNRRTERQAVARRGMAKVLKVTKRLEGKSAGAAISMSGLKMKRKQKQHKKRR